ncbi:MAG: hypothetical protein ACOCV2_03910, partial [Persicimonas sp.]
MSMRTATCCRLLGCIGLLICSCATDWEPAEQEEDEKSSISLSDVDINLAEDIENIFSEDDGQQCNEIRDEPEGSVLKPDRTLNNARDKAVSH